MTTTTNGIDAMNAPVQVTVPARLALRIGRARRLVEVASLAEASGLYSELRDRGGFDVNTMPVYDADSNQLVASLSYNGRIWQGERCLFDPFEAEAAP